MVAVVVSEFEEKRGGRKVWKRGIWEGKRKEMVVEKKRGGGGCEEELGDGLF